MSKLNLDPILKSKRDFGVETHFEIETRLWDQNLIWIKFWGRNSILGSKLDFGVKTRFGRDFFSSKFDFGVETQFWVRNLIWTRFCDRNSTLGSELDFGDETRFWVKNLI